MQFSQLRTARTEVKPNKSGGPGIRDDVRAKRKKDLKTSIVYNHLKKIDASEGTG